MGEVKIKNYLISKEQKMYYSSVLLLENLCNFGHKYPIILSSEQEILEPILVHMASKGWVETNENGYIPTEAGKEVLQNYLGRLHEFRSIYKIYAAVDTGEGEFAYSSFFDFKTDEAFIQHLNQERFEDLRVAVCEFKGMNPLDVIFMEMVDEERFNCDEIGWEAELATGLIWDEMTKIANTNIHVEDLEEGEFTGTEVMTIILEEGAGVLKELMERQLKEDEEDVEVFVDDDEEYDEIHSTEVYYVEEPIFDEYYYEDYYDPYYVSPYWGVYYY
jgi:DNA-binding PadR family transcriptional regulator